MADILLLHLALRSQYPRHYEAAQLREVLQRLPAGFEEVDHASSGAGGVEACKHLHLSTSTA